MGVVDDLHRAREGLRAPRVGLGVPDAVGQGPVSPHG